jgi:Na+/proline symporter
VIYTTSGGSKAVGQTHVLQFSIILATMAVAFVQVMRSLPAGVGPGDALELAGRLGRLHALVTRFDPNDRYNLWSGLIGGFFLQLSYFGTDQSQVGRYLTGRTVAESRLGLLFNGLVKVPMQLFILSLGALVFVFYLFHAAPLCFDPGAVRQVAGGPHAAEYAALEADHHAALVSRERDARAFLGARHAGDRAELAAAAAALQDDQRRVGALRERASELVRASDRQASGSDVNYVFLSFVLSSLPVGLIGLVFAAVFAASMNSTSAELNALASTTVVDVVRRVNPALAEGRGGVWFSRAVTLLWAGFAVAFAGGASRLGSLIEAVNILGSLFYGTILGIFLTAFYLKQVSGRSVFFAALVAEAVVLACFRFTGISFLWYNLIGCGVVALLSLGLEALRGAGPRGPAPRAL